MTTPKELLEARGIYTEAFQLGWRENGTGWHYPVAKNAQGSLIHRWKAYDSNAQPKYTWPEGKTNDCHYYLPKDAKQAILDSHAVYIASGEPDVLTFRAAGIKNTLCWFGEGNVPDAIALDFLEMDVVTAYLYPDRDEVGRNAALKLRQRLTGSGIQLLIYELPESLGDKGDINKLWQQVKFDGKAFMMALFECLPLNLPEPTQSSTQIGLFDDLPTSFYQAIDQAMVTRGVRKYAADGWSNLVPCLFQSHEHDKDRPGGSWNREHHFFKCFKCAERVYLAKEVGDKLGLDWHDFIPKKELPKVAEPTKGPKVIFSWSEVTDTVLSEISGQVEGQSQEPLPIPFRDLREMGGFAYAIPPRKMLALVGDSGDGKTSLAETIVDHWRRQGFNGVMWGPEWSSVEYVYRAIQREGGPSLMDMVHHKAWHAAAKRGVPEAKRPGLALLPERYELARRVATDIKNWQGKLYFVERMGVSVDELLQRFDEVITGAALHGERIHFVVADYAQLFRSASAKANERIDKALADLKGFIADRDLVAVVGSQVTKQDGRSANDGNKMSQASMQNARGDYFNLSLIINREVNDQGQKSSQATIRVAKNSLGKTGDVSLILDEKRMRWCSALTSSVENAVYGK